MKNYLEKFKRFWLISWILRLINPSFGYCDKCKLVWNYCDYKIINLNEFNSIFSMCTYCWENSLHIEKIKSYTKLYRCWDKSNQPITEAQLIQNIYKEIKNGKNII